MLQAISAYSKNIIYFMLFTSFIGIILPSGKYKKYINLCLGLILVFAMLQPFSKLVSGGIPVNKILGGLVNGGVDSQIDLSEYEKKQHELIQASFKEQMSNQIKSLVNSSVYEVYSVDFDMSEDMREIYSITLELTKKEQPVKKSFVRIEPVRIGRVSVDESDTELIKIKNKISDFYNLSVDNIYIRR